jgi:hypothetical protein
MKLLALTFGDENCASTRYRLLQYQPLMEAEGITLDHTPAKSFDQWNALRDYDVVILQKTLLSRHKVRRLAKRSKRLLYDADDRIWLRPGKPYSWFTRLRLSLRVRQICQYADCCMAANGIIAADLRQYGADPVVIPMALDGNIWYPPEKREAPLTIGWTGSPASLQYLEPIRPAMVATQQDHPEVYWQIHCGKDPAWGNLKYEYIPFTPGNEPETVRKFDIGLLPLPAGEFAQGKSPIKALQYFASGVALIHDPVGATVELTENNTLGLAAASARQWEYSFTGAITEQAARETRVVAAREMFLGRHEQKGVFGKLAALLHGS